MVKRWSTCKRKLLVDRQDPFDTAKIPYLLYSSVYSAFTKFVPPGSPAPGGRGGTQIPTLASRRKSLGVHYSSGFPTRHALRKLVGPRILTSHGLSLPYILSLQPPYEIADAAPDLGRTMNHDAPPPDCSCCRERRQQTTAGRPGAVPSTLNNQCDGSAGGRSPPFLGPCTIAGVVVAVRRRPAFRRCNRYVRIR